ncbi:hypothetical protein RDABS01_021483 [Bienertia sinuspersici]
MGSFLAGSTEAPGAYKFKEISCINVFDIMSCEPMTGWSSCKEVPRHGFFGSNDKRNSSIIRGKPTLSESLQNKLADELRDKVIDELIKRQKDAEW